MAQKIIMNQKLVIFLLFISALFIRLIGISTRPIWYDEAFSILFSGKGLNAMLYGTLSNTGTGAADIHPLGYYTFLYVWERVFGQSIQAARMFSICINLATLILVYLISKNLFCHKTANLASLIFAILPFQVHFAQEIRMYSLLSFWLLLATYSFLRGHRGNWKWWIIFSLSSALAQYTHNLAVIYLIPLAITPIILKEKKTLILTGLASGCAVILYAPWLYYLPAQISKVKASYWVLRPGLEKFFTLLLVYLPHLPLPDNVLLPFLIISSITVTLAFFQTFRSWKEKKQGFDQAIWLAYLAIAPPMFLWLISQIIPVYIERVLLPSHAIFCIWIAWSFTETRLPRPVQVLSFCLIFVSALMGIFQHISYRDFPYGDYAALNQHIKTRYLPGDIIIHSNKLTYLPSVYFDPNLPQGYIADPPGSTTDTLAPATREILHAQAFQDLESATKGKKRVWFIIFQKSIDEFVFKGYQTHPEIIYLSNKYDTNSNELIDQIRVVLFQSGSQ